MKSVAVLFSCWKICKEIDKEMDCVALLSWVTYSFSLIPYRVKDSDILNSYEMVMDSYFSSLCTQETLFEVIVSVSKENDEVIAYD